MAKPIVKQNIETINTNVGNLTSLTTQDKTSLVNAVNENVGKITVLSTLLSYGGRYIPPLKTLVTGDTFTLNFTFPVRSITSTSAINGGTVVANCTVTGVALGTGSAINLSPLYITNGYNEYAGFAMFCENDTKACVAKVKSVTADRKTWVFEWTKKGDWSAFTNYPMVDYVAIY